MSEEAEKIYVDAAEPAILVEGDKSTRCPTLAEAVMAWHRLPSSQKAGATIKAAGRLYTSSEIDRLHYGPKPA